MGCHHRPDSQQIGIYRSPSRRRFLASGYVATGWTTELVPTSRGRNSRRRPQEDCIGSSHFNVYSDTSSSIPCQKPNRNGLEESSSNDLAGKYAHNTE